MARLKLRAARRVALREYLPFAASIASWAMLGLAVGHADAVRLLAINAFVQAIRALVALQLLPALGRRIGGPVALWRASVGKALRIDVGSLLASAALAIAMIAVLDARGMEKPALMLAFLALGIPARHPGQLLVAKRLRIVHWRMGAATVAVAGAAAILLFGWHWQAAAVVIALRDWGGLLATVLFAPRRKARKQPESQPLGFAEVAARTEVTARRRLSYRMLKSVLVGILGPAGGIAARTGRGAGVDARIARFVPRHRGGLAAFAVATAGASSLFIMVSREPSTLLLAGVFARLAGSAGSALLWWSYRGVSGDDDDDDDADD